MDKSDNKDEIFEMIEEQDRPDDQEAAGEQSSGNRQSAAIESEPVQSEEKTEKKKKRKKKEEVSVKGEMISWVKMIVSALLLAVIIDKFIIVNATVPTGSMENTIMTGSRMLGFRFSYLFGEPKRGDIVVFKYPLNENESYVKRIIGLPGETVYIEEGKIYIQKTEGGEKELLEEKYLKEEWVNRTGNYTFKIPKGRYLMLGDNRNSSADARVWLEYVKDHNMRYPDDQWNEDVIYVKKSKILGKAIMTYWPIDNIKILN